MLRLQVEHATTYRYQSTVTPLPHRLLLRPREGQDSASNPLNSLSFRLAS